MFLFVLYHLKSVLIFALLYASINLLKYGKINIPEDNNIKNRTEIENILENLSIRTGVEKPQYKIIEHSNLNIFSLHPIFGKPTIYITTSLFSLLNKNEKEAVFANQFVEISTGKLFDYAIIHNSLEIIKGFSFIFF